MNKLETYSNKVYTYIDTDGFEHKLSFLCSAIRFMEPIHKVVLDRYGKRHHHILESIRAEGYTDAYKKSHLDGFMVKIDNHILFFERNLATTLAERLGIEIIGSALTSEDLW